MAILHVGAPAIERHDSAQGKGQQEALADGTAVYRSKWMLRARNMREMALSARTTSSPNPSRSSMLGLRIQALRFSLEINGEFQGSLPVDH